MKNTILPRVRSIGTYTPHRNAPIRSTELPPRTVSRGASLPPKPDAAPPKPIIVEAGHETSIGGQGGYFEPHHLANLFPLLLKNSQTFTDLVEDIRANGLHEPIILFEGKILDGRNRLAACRALHIPLKTEEYKGDAPLAYVASKNLHRRHLTDDQRAAVAAKLLPELEKEAEVRRIATVKFNLVQNQSKNNGSPIELKPTQSGLELDHKPNASRRAVAEFAGVSADRVRRANELANTHPDLAKKVEAGSMKLSEAERQVAKVAPKPECSRTYTPGASKTKTPEALLSEWAVKRRECTAIERQIPEGVLCLSTAEQSNRRADCQAALASDNRMLRLVEVAHPPTKTSPGENLGESWGPNSGASSKSTKKQDVVDVPDEFAIS